MQQPSHHFEPLKGYENFEATTQIMIAEILTRQLPFEIIDPKNNLLAVTFKNREFIIHEGTISDANSLISFWISNDKWMTKQFLQRKGVNFAKAVILGNKEKLKPLSLPSYPLVVKPVDTDHGIGVSTSINNEEQLKVALERAFKYSDKAIVEEFFPGKEFRFLVVEGVVRAIAYREPANIVGDGISSVGQLIDRKNVGRGDDYRFPLLKIKVDDEVTRHLNAQSLTIHSVVPSEEKVYLRKNSNLSTGGDSIDVTDTIPAFYKDVAVKAVGAAGLRIAGVDIIISDLNNAPSQTSYIVVELNAPPMLSMHNYPYIGVNRHVEKYVLDCILNS
ncbi:MAG TPA: glutamate ligase [Bacteroidales bacterium]|jgi:glutamate--cysteine ligase|nr:glutamate ligase [Bacteroidales bacterium]